MVIEIAVLLIGALCLFCGYKLLMRGMYPAQEAGAAFHSQGLLKRSAPGLLFSMFGAAIVIGGILHSTHAYHRQPAVAEESESSAPASTQAPRRKHVRAKEPRQSAGTAQSVQPKVTAPSAPVEPALEDIPQPPQPTRYVKPGRA